MKFKDTKYGDLTGKIYNKNLDISNYKLTSLEGCPKIVNGYFDCSHNLIKDFSNGPEIVNGEFYADNNPNLVSMKGFPTVVLKDISIISSKLQDVNLPIETKSVTLMNNNIKSLKGSPERVYGDFNIRDNDLTTLDGLPGYIEFDLKIRKNPLKDTTAILYSDIKGKIFSGTKIEVPSESDRALFNHVNKDIKKYKKLKKLKDLKV